MRSGDEPAPGYCFVTGCPRSGTSAATRLINGHPAMAIGEERYRLLVHDLRVADRLDRFGPELFEPDRFGELAVEEVGAEPGKADLNTKAARRLAEGGVRWVGDKLIPLDRPLVDAWVDGFPGVRIVYVRRDPVRVAASFQRRADDPTDHWPTHLDHRAAPRLWRASLDALDHAHRRLGPDQVHVVDYDDLFSPDDTALRDLFAFLDLDPEPVRQRWERFTDRARRGGPSGLTPDQERWVRRRTGTLARLGQRAIGGSGVERLARRVRHRPETGPPGPAGRTTADR